MNPPATIWSPAYRSATVGLFSLAFLVAYSVSAITTAMPRAAHELHGLNLYGLAFAVTMATSVVAMTFAAPWIERAGPGVALMAGIAVDCAGLLVAAAAPTMEVLVAGRAVQGIGVGLEGVALYVVIARVFPAAIRPKMFATLSAAWVLPSIIGPAINGAVTDQFGWRWVFVTVPVVAVGAVALVRAGTRGASMDAGETFDRADDDGQPGLSARTGSASGNSRATAPRSDFGTNSIWYRPLLALAAACAVLLLGDASLRAHPWWPGELAAAVVVLVLTAPKLLPRGTWLARRGLPAVVLMRALIGTAFTLGDVYLPLLMIQQRAMPAWLAGLSLTVGGITWFAGSWLAGRGVMTPRLRLQLGAVALLLGVLVSALVVLPAVPVWVAWLGWCFSGLGIGISYPSLSVILLELSAASEQGSNSSALQLNETLTTSALLGVVGAVFAALLSTGGLGFVVPFGLAAVLSLASVFVARRAA
ncbi:MFS transporter [Paenarthrobacter sp. Z7-10]|uniref:MFS transporter n=1 Tax=Paenarthrobacter sp. Z7-10 TaxID=2787635 RepID=UPI0022A91112|nr:MFS transporter [Paenarthrobacter sp. Z7-10]MCZ2403136.1 MFS transporter [Paenarthrobacter sp. Z7-10]